MKNSRAINKITIIPIPPKAKRTTTKNKATVGNKGSRTGRGYTDLFREIGVDMDGLCIENTRNAQESE